MDQLIEPGRIRLPLKRPDNCSVISMACGRAHSVIVVEDEGGMCRHQTYFVSLLISEKLLFKYHAGHMGQSSSISVSDEQSKKPHYIFDVN